MLRMNIPRAFKTKGKDERSIASDGGTEVSLELERHSEYMKQTRLHHTLCEVCWYRTGHRIYTQTCTRLRTTYIHIHKYTHMHINHVLSVSVYRIHWQEFSGLESMLKKLFPMLLHSATELRTI